MIPTYELKKAIKIAKKYRIEKLYLLGSSLYKNSSEINDYDFAVSGVPKGIFFNFYGELFRTLSKNVDLINLSGKMKKFKRIILREGKLVYDKAST